VNAGKTVGYNDLSMSIKTVHETQQGAFFKKPIIVYELTERMRKYYGI